MNTLKIEKKEIPGFLDRLKNAYRLYGPVRYSTPALSTGKNGIVHFLPIEDVSEIDLSFQNSRLSPKSLFLPQTERMFEYSLDPADNDAHVLKEMPEDDSPRAVIGIRPCDAKALELVDVNFDTPRFRDPWWIRAREVTTLVGLGCADPCSTCFCTSVGGGPFDETGLDVLLTEADDAFLVKVLTEKGEKLVEFVGIVESAGQELIQAAEAVQREAAGKILSKVDISRLAQIDTLAIHGADFWKEVQFACINCGICTFLCPTCWCFDIQDETHGRSGCRMRNWDSCMFPLFTLHASGHNPRGQKIQRVRQRFMHKLKYYLDTYNGGVACVGCGRCVQHCPVNIDIREVCRLMNEYGN